MTLIVTVGGSESNSLCTLAEADGYIAASRYDKTAWDEMSDEEKENLLILAGKVMNNLAWTDHPVYRNQAMEPAPRWSKEEAAEYAAGDPITVPDHLKKAQAYIAYDFVHRRLCTGSANPADGAASDAIQRFSLFGDLTVTFADGEHSLTDAGRITAALRSEHPEIWWLISEDVTEVRFIGDWNDEAPALLDEVT